MCVRECVCKRERVYVTFHIRYWPVTLCHPVAVRINTALSEKLLMRYGVPQGSILGPLLFTAYTNDLPSIPQHCSADCYVDDT